MKTKLLLGLTCFSLLFVFLSLFLIQEGITGAVVLQHSTQFVQQHMIATSQTKLVSLVSLVFGIVALGTLTLGIFHRAKSRKYKELDAVLEKEMHYQGLCEK